tara:strand:+ start:1421 stop:1684 length:264 start_codon:yes stop_codon:yes gene_type:complete
MNEEYTLEVAHLRAQNFAAGLHFYASMQELVRQSQQIDGLRSSVWRARHVVSDWKEICKESIAQTREINATFQEVGNRLENLFGISA